MQCFAAKDEMKVLTSIRSFLGRGTPASLFKLGVCMLDVRDGGAVTDAYDPQHFAVCVQLLQRTGLQCHICLHENTRPSKWLDSTQDYETDSSCCDVSRKVTFA